MEDEGVSETIESIFKRDDDARLLQTPNGEIYVETTEHIDVEDISFPLTNANLMREASLAQPMDANIRPLSMLFLIQGCLNLIILLFALPLYYWPLNQTLRIIILVLSANAFVAFYAAMLAWKDYAIPFIACFAFSASGIIGSIGSAIPLIFMGLVWMQNISVFIYIQLAKRDTSHVYAIIIMIFVTISIWSVNIVTYDTGHEWIAGIVCLVLALCNALYAGWQLKIGDKRYNNGSADMIKSVVQYYGDPVLIAIQKINALKT